MPWAGATLVILMISQFSTSGRGDTPILGHEREVSHWWHPIFYPIWSLFYALSWSEWPLLSAEKNGLSLSHLVPEILGPKVGQIFTKMYLSVLSILYQFSPWFSIQLIPFFTDIRSFWPSFLQNIRFDWFQIFYRMLNMATEKLKSTTPGILTWSYHVILSLGNSNIEFYNKSGRGLKGMWRILTSTYDPWWGILYNS